MLDFIPQKNKKEINIEYIYRGIVFLLAFLLLGVLLLILFFIPSAIYSKYKNRTIANQLEITRSSLSQNSTDIVSLVKKLNGIADILFTDTSKLSSSNLISKIFSLKNQNINITSFSASKLGDGSTKLVISGISKNRDDLTLFNKALVNDGSFSSVDLPVSDLIKNIDQDFSITLIYKTK